MTAEEPLDDRQTVREHFRVMRALADAALELSTTSQLQRDDARNSFFDVVHNVVNVYCISLGFELVASLQRRVATGDDVMDEVMNVFGKQVYKTQTLNYYRAKQRGHLFFDVWCGFEDSLRTVYEAVVPAAEQEEHMAAANGHVGIPTVWKSVSKIAKPAAGASTEMRAAFFNTVDFCASARNTVHSDTVFRGKSSKSLGLKRGGKLMLEPGQPTNFLSRPVLPLLIEQLVDAWTYVRNGVASPPRIAPPPHAKLNPYAYG